MRTPKLGIQVRSPLVRIEYVFSFQVWYCELCVKKTDEWGGRKHFFKFLFFFFLAFYQLNISWKSEGKRYLDLFFSLPARLEQLNTAQKLGILKLFIFYSVTIFYSLSSRPLPSRPLFLIVLDNGGKTFTWERRDLRRVSEQIIPNFIESINRRYWNIAHHILLFQWNIIKIIGKNKSKSIKINLKNVQTFR